MLVCDDISCCYYQTWLDCQCWVNAALKSLLGNYSRQYCCLTSDSWWHQFGPVRKCAACWADVDTSCNTRGWQSPATCLPRLRLAPQMSGSVNEWWVWSARTCGLAHTNPWGYTRFAGLELGRSRSGWMLSANNVDHLAPRPNPGSLFLQTEEADSSHVLEGHVPCKEADYNL